MVRPKAAAVRCRHCRRMPSSSCRCATPCCSRASCCRSRSAGRSRSRRRSRPCASSARSASCCSARPRSTIPPRSTCIASARSPTCCASSPRRTAPIMSSARASSASRSSNSLRLAVPGRARAAHSGARHPHAGNRGAFRQPAGASRRRRSSCCRRRRPNCSPRSSRSSRRRRSPISATAYMDVKPDEKQEILETVDLARADGQGLAARWRTASRCCACRRRSAGRPRRRSTSGSAKSLLREQMAAIQKQLGEGEEARPPRSPSWTRPSPKPACRRRSRTRRARNCAGCRRMPEAAAEYGMIRTYLDWLIELPWKLPEEEPIDIKRGAPHPRRGPLRPREDQAAHPRIPRGAQARAAGQGADPVLRRPARRRQDLARPVDRARHGPQVRPRQSSAACTTRRRSAATGAPISARCPATSSRRIRKAGTRNCVMMLDEIDKLGAGFHGDPASALLEVLDPEQNNDVPRQLPRRAVRPVARGVHRHRQHARHHSGAAARPHGDHQPRRLHRRREAADRAALSGASGSSRRTASRPSRSRSTTTRSRDIIQRLHARGRRAQPGARRSARCCATPRCASPKATRGRCRITRGDLVADPRARRASRTRSRCATSVPGRRHRPRLDAGRRRHPVHRGDPHARHRQADPHRPARRRDEGKRAGRAQPRQEPRARRSASTRSASRRATSTSTCRPARSRRTGRAPGVAMFMALASLLTDRTVRSDTAMTGEISLRGLVLPVGGIKEKVVAAHSAGIRRVMLPARNRSGLRRHPRERAQADGVRLARARRGGGRRRARAGAV